MNPTTSFASKLTVVFVSAFVAFSSGCALNSQLRYDPASQPARPLATGVPLQKTDTLSLIAAKDFTQWEPADFPVDVTSINRSVATHPRSFQFAVAADVQIHDRGFGFGPRFSRFADKNPFMPVETTERNFYQDHSDAIYFGFVLNAMRRAMEQNTNIDFAIHLGDSMQFCKQSELGVFNEMIGKFLVNGASEYWQRNWTGTWLQTPIHFSDRKADFFNVIGNHDVMFLGNFNEHGPLRLPPDAIFNEDALDSTLARTAPFAQNGRPAMGGDAEAGGYYFSDRAMPDGKRVRLVVLNTNEKNIMAPLIPNLQCGTLYPSISGEQADWLAVTLGDADRDPAIGCVVVFGHNQFSEITINRTGKRHDRDASFGQVPQIIASCDKLAAYLCGHLHSGSPAMRHQIGARSVKEIIVPSVQEFPKSFGMARIDPLANGRYDVAIDYFNIEDVADLSGIREVDVRDSKVEPQQKRFNRWLAALSADSLRTADRMKLLAKYAYVGSKFDAAHDHRTGIDDCFHPKFAKRLAAEYWPAAKIWDQMLSSQNWPALRLHLEGRDTETQMAAQAIPAVSAR